MSGLRILPRTRSANAALVARFQGLPVANISDCMHRMAAAGPRLRPMHQGGALDLAQPGDVIVGDADGVVCVPFDEAGAVLAATLAKGEAEKKTLADIACGTHDTSWMDAALKRIGCALTA